MGSLGHLFGPSWSPSRSLSGPPSCSAQEKKRVRSELHGYQARATSTAYQLEREDCILGAGARGAAAAAEEFP
eukprot:5118125-Pyramimonas_sp.AAC.1